ncbi:unnamed protein product [Adineta steineri]|uniref:C3H1-type domain-containing protein n=2 Tax=Adineta steineri TaxID=433720 RepID=A0A814USJ7_9BILA|nr:unnamed protein product [Adineta steineri]
MDIDIVNTILRLCIEQQTCLFEISFLCDYCLEHRLCSNSKYVLASIKNYLEIFKISRDQNRIEFFMPFEICRNHVICQDKNGTCSNIHVCYDHFYTSSCRRLMNCPYPHNITKEFHEDILGPLMNLDLDVLTRVFRVYCQSKKHLINHNSSKGQQQSTLNSSITNNPTPSSSLTKNWRVTTTPQINGNSSWKKNNRQHNTSKTLPKQQTIPQMSDKGVQICWQPGKNIQTHFIEVVFSNHNKSDGGPIRTHQIYQHLGVAQVFYENSDTADQVITHGSVTFQSFTFTPRLLQQTIDTRHVCFSNIPIITNRLTSYIDIVSMPYTKNKFEYYQNDKQIIVVEYNEDIDFSKIVSNVRSHPECNGSMINCIQLYQPETLFIEYDQEYFEDDIRKLFDKTRIFHVKTYPHCSFVHFYSHNDLIQSINKTFHKSIRLTPIYINIYSQNHLKNYLQQRQIELPEKLTTTTTTTTVSSSSSSPVINKITQQETILPVQKMDSSLECHPSNLPIDDQQTEVNQESKSLTEEEIHCPSSSSLNQTIIVSNSQPLIEDKNAESIVNTNDGDDETTGSEDDFHDLPSDFDNDDIFLDESNEHSGDMEFIRSAAKNLMSSLAEMEAASANTSTIDAPHSLLYGDDYIVTIKSRRFALAFLDYTQFRVEKQRTPDKFRLLASLKKLTNKKKQNDNIQEHDRTLSPTLDTKTSKKKKRNKRNNKKKNVNNNNSTSKGIV